MAIRTPITTDRSVAINRSAVVVTAGGTTSGNGYGLLLAITTDITTSSGSGRDPSTSRT